MNKIIKHTDEQALGLPAEAPTATRISAEHRLASDAAHSGSAPRAAPRAPAASGWPLAAFGAAAVLGVAGLLVGKLTWMWLAVPLLVAAGSVIGATSPVAALSLLLTSILLEGINLSVLRSGTLHLRIDEVWGPSVALGLLVRAWRTDTLRWRLSRIPGLVPLVLFLLANLPSTLLNPGQLGRGLSLYAMLVAGGLCYVAVGLAAAEVRSAWQITFPLLVSAFAEALTGLIPLAVRVVVKRPTIPGVAIDSGTHLIEPVGTMFEPNFFGQYMGIACVFVVALALGLAARHRLRSPAGVVLLLTGALTFAGTILSLSRAAWLALGFGLAVAAVLAARTGLLARAWGTRGAHLRQRVRGWVAWVPQAVRYSALIIGCAAGGYAVVKALASGAAARLAMRLAGPVGQRLATLLNFQSGSGFGRIQILQLALADWLNNPLLGLGNGSFNRYLPLQTDRPWIYSAALSILHDSGLIGLALAAWFVFAIMRAAWHTLLTTRYLDVCLLALGALGAASLLLLAAQGTSSLYLMFFWVVLGLVGALPALDERLGYLSVLDFARRATAPEATIAHAAPRGEEPASDAPVAGRIIHVLDATFVGGGPSVLLSAARGLAAHGWESSVICGNDGPLASDLDQLHIPVEALAIAGKYRFLRHLPTITRRLQQASPDAVILYGPIAGCLGGIASRLAAVPCILYSAQYPSYYADRGLRRRLRNALVERIACACAHGIWCTSTADLALYRARQASRSRTFQVIPNCVASDRLARLVQVSAEWQPRDAEDAAPSASMLDQRALRASLGLPPAGPVVGFVGRLMPWKGADVLLRAFSTVTGAVPGARLVVVGDGPDRASLEELSKALGLAGHVVFAGQQRDVAPYLALSDVVTVPSRHEPFGIVALEALAAGRPVVASRVGGLNDTIRDGISGRLVPPDDPEQLAAAIVDTLQNPTLGRQLALSGRERILSDYTEDLMASRVDTILRNLLAAQAAAAAAPPLRLSVPIRAPHEASAAHGLNWTELARNALTLWLPGALVGGAGLLLALYRLGSFSLWFDESFSSGLALQSPPVLLQWATGTESNMAGYYLILHWWLGLTQWLGLLPTELVVRLPSAVFAALGAAAVYAIGLQLGGRTLGIIAGLLYALNPMQLYDAQDARGYSLQLMLTCLSWLALILALRYERNGKRWWACYVAATVVSVYAQLVSVLVLAAQVLTFAILCVLPGPLRQSARRNTRAMALSLLAIGLLLVPAASAARNGGGNGWVPAVQPGDVYAQLVAPITGRDNRDLILVGALVSLGLLASVWGRSVAVTGFGKRVTQFVLGVQRPGAFMVFCWLALPVAMSYVLTQPQLNLHLFTTRYLNIAVPPFCLLVARGIVSVRWRIVQGLLALALLLSAVMPALTYYSTAEIQNFRGPERWIQQNYEPGDGLICFPTVSCAIPMQYYFAAYPGPAQFGSDYPGAWSWLAVPTPSPSDPAALAAYSANHARVFFVSALLTPDATQLRQQLTARDWLNAHGFLLSETEATVATSGLTVSVQLYQMESDLQPSSDVNPMACGRPAIAQASERTIPVKIGTTPPVGEAEPRSMRRVACVS